MTKPEYLKESTGDFDRKWVQSYVRIREVGKGGYRPFYITNIQAADNSQGWEFEGNYVENGKKTREYRINPHSTRVDVDFSSPQPGIVWAGRCLYFVYRQNARQWKQGFNSETFAAQELLRPTRRYLGYKTTTAWGPAATEQLFSPTYAGKAGIKEVWDGQVFAAPITSTLWVGHNIFYSQPVVGYMHRTIGEVVDRDGRVRLFPYAEFLSKTLKEVEVVE